MSRNLDRDDLLVPATRYYMGRKMKGVPEQKCDVCLALMRITVQVTADFLRDDPEAVEEYLRLNGSPARRAYR